MTHRTHKSDPLALSEPKPLMVRNIPEVLRRLPQFVLWKSIIRNREPTKVPFTCDGNPAKANVPATWTTFERVVARFERGGYAGIGFEFSIDGGLCGIDLDECIDAAGNVAPWARSILDRFRGRAYGEISPSGRGVKLFVRATPRRGFNVKVHRATGEKLPRTKGKAAGKLPGVECYGNGRFFALTGRQFEDFGQLGDSQAAVDMLVDRYAPAKPQSPPASMNGRNHTGEIDLLKRARLYLAKVDPAISGQGGHDATYRAAAILVIGFNLSPADSFSLLAEWNLGCQPRWSEHDLRRKLAEADKIPGERGQLVNADDWRNGEHRRRRDATAGLPAIDRAEGRTEKANADRLISAHGQGLLWVEDWNCWLVWDGCRWARDRQRTVEARMKSVVDSFWQTIADSNGQVGDKTIGEMVRFAKSSGSANAIRNAVYLARSEPGIAVLPEMFDRQPMLLNCRNGTLDLEKGELRPADRADFITKLAPVNFDPTATCPLWYAMLERITAGDRELMGYLQRVAGYSITGLVREHVLFFAYGRGANGKSTFLNRILDTLGPDYSMTAPSELFMVRRNEAHPTERADLAGKRFVVTIESEDGKRLAESFVKSITGGDRIRARRIRENAEEFAPCCKLWLASNHKPIIRGDDDGIWRRIKLVPFAFTIPAAEQDRELPEKLKAEASGILNWLVLGALQYQDRGLDEPKAVTVASSEYRSESDILGQFIAEHCELAPEARTAFGDLYAAYVAACEAVKRSPISKTAFGLRLSERGIEDIPRARPRMRQGIQLVQAVESDEFDQIPVRADHART